MRSSWTLDYGSERFVALRLAVRSGVDQPINCAGSVDLVGVEPAMKSNLYDQSAVESISTLSRSPLILSDCATEQEVGRRRMCAMWNTNVPKHTAESLSTSHTKMSVVADNRPCSEINTRNPSTANIGHRPRDKDLWVLPPIGYRANTTAA